MPNIIKGASKVTSVKPKIKKVKPKKVKKSALVLAPKATRSKNASDYYHCLLTYANQNWYSPEGKKKKITACCKDCKQNAPALNSQRDQELVKLITSYKQVGDSLAKLLQPIK